MQQKVFINGKQFTGTLQGCNRVSITDPHLTWFQPWCTYQSDSDNDRNNYSGNNHGNGFCVFVNQAHARPWPAWFVEIDFVCDVCVCVSLQSY